MGPPVVYIAVIGAGGVGAAFLAQLSGLVKVYPEIHPVLISRSTQSLLGSLTDKLDLDTWSEDLQASNVPALSPEDVLSYLSATSAPSIIVDNTSNQEVANAYPLFLRQGISVITPNKKAFSAGSALWNEIKAARRSPQSPVGGLLYHESSVGAGLPIISTLNDLIDTGDSVLRIEGVFSGTLSFLFNSFSPTSGQGGRWSEEVKKAKSLGYTEPDPRDDLNGMDVARKVVILARVAGIDIQDTDALTVENLVPETLRSCSGAEFLRGLDKYDDQMEARKAEASRQGKVLRFTGLVDIEKQQYRVGLQPFDRDHAIAGLKGSDNVFSFYTKRYGERPLLVQGSGAGADLTAMGVTSDLIKCLQRL